MSINKKRIDILLVEKGFFETRQKAKYAIDNKNIYVNDKLILKSSKEIDIESKIEVKGDTLPFVSRRRIEIKQSYKSIRY